MASTTGKYGRGLIASAAMAGLTQWTVEEVGDELDSTNAESNGLEEIDVGVIGPRITLEGYHKLGSGPFPGLRTGTLITNVTLFLNRNVSASTWAFTAIVVTRVRSSMEVRGQIRFSVEARNAEGGTWVGPTA